MQKLSRSKLELFLKCPRCFWLDVKHGVKQPSFPPYTINNAVDYLLKQEFDIYREKGEPHPIMTKAGVDAVPYRAPEMETWRHNFTGIQYDHKDLDFHVFGAVDDIWVNPLGELIVVDYKATGSNQHQIYDGYRRQMEIYQWLLKGNGYRVSPRGYFVFARVDKGQGFGNGEAVLPFHIFVEPLDGDSSWVNTELANARRVLSSTAPPVPSAECEHCNYRLNSLKVASRAVQEANAKLNTEKAQGSLLDPA
jgi:hypothetical protein